MIKYQLVCNAKHEFDSWFRSSSDYDNQLGANLLSCPQCGSPEITKALMAPNVATGRKSTNSTNEFELSGPSSEFAEDVKKLREQVSANADYVGTEFSEEARKIHYGEASKRGIYGEANIREISELNDEGIKVLPLPSLPDEKN